ncbi:hypothetical protein D1816_01320 [Aquimarina sp. AD10]|uniref:Thioredoxin domain-containing protein n=1 Tax=Aquimarina aggregata TaxID=1642818 RepID=A0A163BLP2_9FLAO|nr:MULTISPECIES: hypothetical protein [Aquimarina]AXT59045.1 hypothetical protein D1816_01320 [Aquimarina sp. AD10]KZS41521.1 hypothetical protein AWE51_21170 [Aquimarina aggregata]RKM93378.1 hypothetical protein D7033_19775 [Aquimarina sp. AD10]
MRFSLILYLAKVSLISYCLSSCSSPEKNERSYTYFGGEIVNPNTNYVILSKDNGLIDTIPLDKNNRFLHKIENLEEGLYFFQHKPENQIVLLEKGDSILVRLNTIEFDESLVFTGDGARKNNFLVEMYLQNEMERERLKKSELQLAPSYFQKNQDSLLSSKLKAFDQFIDKYHFTPLAKKVAQACIVFDYYTRHELYFHNRYGIGGLDATKDLPRTFFNYRNSINFNDEQLKHLFSYNRYLNYYFTNSSLTEYSNSTKITYRGRVGNVTHKLNLIDSIVQHPYIKDNLLRRVTTNFLLRSKNNKDSNTVLRHYLSVSTNKDSQQELRKLARSISRLRPNRSLPEQELIASNGEIIKLSSLFSKPITALYFWSMDRKDHYTRAHKKASYLSSLYPDIDFIAINTDDEQTKNWLKTIKRNHYNLGKEYEFKYPKCSSQELVIFNRNKVILVDNYGNIINSNANLFSSIFEKQLIKYTTRLSTIEAKKSYASNRK